MSNVSPGSVTGTSTQFQFWKPPVFGTLAVPSRAPVVLSLRTSIRLVVFGEAIRKRTASTLTRFTSENVSDMPSCRKPTFWLPPSGSAAVSLRMFPSASWCSACLRLGWSTLRSLPRIGSTLPSGEPRSV